RDVAAVEGAADHPGAEVRAGAALADEPGRAVLRRHARLPCSAAGAALAAVDARLGAVLDPVGAGRGLADAGQAVEALAILADHAVPARGAGRTGWPATIGARLLSVPDAVAA